eukprot:TRINITY_DN11869_c0_g1_i1.p1 TRINITY_DN11869_c0_g1~~TRINITY_DN11869_c0_g1_i1.p1  ORF type:complete len:148 (-),score=12.99 TRINITY_DN11869_c0_g1_i1:210-653(-)
MTVGKREVDLHIWDTAGQERFGSLSSSYFSKASIAVIVYDITCKILANVGPESLESVKSWAKKVRYSGGEEAIIVVVGNKSDLEDERRVNARNGKKLAMELKALFFEASTKLGTNVNTVFTSAVPTAFSLDQLRNPLSFLSFYQAQE